MSAGYVRDTMRTWAAEIAAALSIPFYDTINRNVNPSEAVWFSLEFYADAREGMFCEAYMETGSATLIVVAQPGIGDSQAILAIEQLIPAFWEKKDAGGLLTLENWQPVFEDSGGSADHGYRVGALFDYRLSIT